MTMIHPAWCIGPLCTATASAGEHRGELVPIDLTGIEPVVQPILVQLVQPVAVGGGTPALVLQLGADRFDMPRGVAQSLVDQVVPLIWQADQVDQVADLPEPRGASA